MYQYRDGLFLFFSSTHKIVGISTLSKPEHVIAQTRELACTKLVLPQVISRGNILAEPDCRLLSWSVRLQVPLCELIACVLGLKPKEVAHDIQLQVGNYVTKELKMVNSFDTWHGNVQFRNVLF